MDLVLAAVWMHVATVPLLWTSSGAAYVNQWTTFGWYDDDDI